MIAGLVARPALCLLPDRRPTYLRPALCLPTDRRSAYRPTGARPSPYLPPIGARPAPYLPPIGARPSPYLPPIGALPTCLIHSMTKETPKNPFYLKFKFWEWVLLGFFLFCNFLSNSTTLKTQPLGTLFNVF